MKEVALIGFASSTNKYVFDLPEDVPIWSLNDAFNKGFPRLDLIFDPHHIEHIKHPAYIEGREDHSRIDWLHDNTELPLMMLKAYDEVPMAEAYPINEVIEMLGNTDDLPLTSTFSLMMGYALLKGYERIYVYGFNMGVEYEYLHQYPGGYAMIWYARAKGVEVIGPPKGSRLFHPTRIYGYEGTAMITRRTLEKIQGAYKVQVENNKKDFNQWVGIFNERKGKYEEYMKAAGNGKHSQKRKKEMEEALIEAQKNIRTYDTQRFASMSVVEAFQRLVDEADMIEVDPVEIEIRGITHVDSQRVRDPGELQPVREE